MKAKITERVVKSLEPAEKPFEVVDTQLRGFILRVQPSGRMTYYFTYRNKANKRARIKIGLVGSVTVAQARDLAEEYSANVTKGVDVQNEKKTERLKAIQIRERTLERFLETHYEPWVLQNRKGGKRTVETIRRNFSDFNKLPLKEISLLLVEQWRTKRLKKGVKASTINRDVTSLRGLLTKAVEWEAIEYHPLSKLKPLKIDSSPNIRYLSQQEEKRLMAALKARDQSIKDGRDRGNLFRKERGYEFLPSLQKLTYGDRLTPMVILSLKTGLRQGELFDLRWKDISFDNNMLTIRGESTKANRTRHIPLAPSAREALESWKTQQREIEPEHRVFPGKKGSRLDNVKRSWSKLLKDAEISKFRWHDMRHDFASKLVMKGVPLNTVRDLCGHADISTTLRYAHLAPEHKAEAVALLG